MAKLDVDVWRRSKSLLGVAAGVVGHELKHQVTSRLSAREKLGLAELKTRIEQAKLVAAGFGRLKGAFMKAGQLLSIDASDLLPPEAVEILSKLQGQAEPVDFEIMHGVLSSELGAERLAELSELDPVAVASASIGQVYRANVFGEPVAIKVQYPGISESIDADVDLEKFRALLADDARFDVPRSLPELSTQRVLTMSWADGLPIRTSGTSWSARQSGGSCCSISARPSNTTTRSAPATSSCCARWPGASAVASPTTAWPSA